MIMVGVLHRNDTRLAKMFLDKFYSSKESEKCKLVWLDNASTDESVEVVTAQLRNTDLFLKSDTNLGVIGGRNKIFDVFANDDSSHLIFLDNDQIVSPGWLDNYMSHADFNGALLGLEAWQLDNNLKPFKMCSSNDRIFSYVGCGGMCIPRDIFLKIGKFDSNLGMAYFEDPDYCFRIFDYGLEVKWNPNKHILHLAHQTLGKMNNRSEMFSKSAQYFRNKWRSRKDLILRGKI